MSHVPAEVLQEIFTRPDLKDRLKYMLVCRLWHDILDKGSLLHTIMMINCQFPKFKEMIERQPYRATQVEYLTLYSNSRRDFDRRILCNMFPILKEIIFLEEKTASQATNHLDTSFHFTYPTSKLEKISDFGECELACQLAMSNLCSNLKSFELTGRLTFDVFSQLKNMPVLETLSVTFMSN